MPAPDQQLKEIQGIQLAMLKALIGICEKHRLRYFLLGGSALGAVRHQGVIPWDDDIDVGMPRPDYDRFLAVAQAELAAHYFLQSYDTDPSYPLSFSKIRNSNTAFIQPNVAHLNMNHGVFIDVFPLDGCSQSIVLRKIQMFRFSLYRTAVLHKLGIKHAQRIARMIVACYAALRSLAALRNRNERLMRQYNYDASVFVMNWGGAWGLKEAMPKHFFGKGRRVIFEESSVNIPQDYHGYLTSLYGDYMMPPPIEGRKAHAAGVIDTRNSFRNYVGGSQ